MRPVVPWLGSRQFSFGSNSGRANVSITHADDVDTAVAAPSLVWCSPGTSHHQL